MIQKHSTSKFATKLKFKIYKPNKNSQFFLCVSTNTDINKINWRFNHIFLVITNRDFYCMTEISSSNQCHEILFKDVGSREPAEKQSLLRFKMMLKAERKAG